MTPADAHPPAEALAPAPVRSARRSLIGAAVLASVLGLFLGLLAHTVVDPDLFGHLRYGLDTLRHGTPDVPDPYSFLTAGRRWLDDEWLSEVVLTLAWRAGGEPALLVLKAGLATGIILLAVRPLLRLAGGLRVALVVAPPLVLLFLRMLPLRAQLFSELLFLALLLVLARAEEGDRRGLVLLPGIFLLWANLHAAWILGLALLGGWLVVHAWSRRTFPAAAALAVAAAAAATLVNPWGAAVHLFLLRTATVPRPDIVEWVPLALSSFTGAAYLVTLAFAAAAFLADRERKHAGLWAVLAVTAILPLTAARHTDIFALAALVVAAPHALRALDRFRPDRARRVGLAALSPLLLVAAATTFAAAPFPMRCLAGVPGDPYPMRAALTLRALGSPADVVVPFDWGEYVTFVAGPAIRVSYDGRRDTIYSDSVMAMGWDFDRGVAGWDRVLGRGGQLVLTKAGTRTDSLMARRAGWAPVYADRVARVFAPAGSALGPRIVRAAAVAHRSDDDAGSCLVERSAPADLARE